MDLLCNYSRHKLNSTKSKIYFSTNVDEPFRTQLGKVLGFQCEEDLGFYLRVPLSHRRNMKNTFQFVVDKVQKRLNGFEGKMLSLARRITLAKLVLLAILGYFMQTALILIGICEKIEQIDR